MNKEKRIYSALSICSLAFAFFWLPAPRLFDISCIALILLFVPATLLPAYGDLRKDPMIRLGALFFLYVVLSIIWHRLTLPDTFPNTTSDRRFLRVLYFIAIAYAISRSQLLTPWRLLAIAFAGLLTYLAISFDQNEWLRAWNGERVDFGIHNAQHTGIVFATCTLAFSLFMPRFFAWAKGRSPALAVISSLLWVLALMFSLWGVFVAQTRAVWLGLSATVLLLPGILLFAYSLRGKPRLSLRKSLITSAIGIALLALLSSAINLPGLISERLSEERVTWESLRQAATHETHDLSSIEVRVASWSAAADWIMEKPFMGWGGRGSRPLIRQSDLFSDSFKEQYNHLHNSYLQVLVEIGFIGAVFIIVLMALLARSSVSSYRRHAMPLDAFLFAWTFFIFWLVVNVFESYIIYPSGTYLVAIVAGFFYSFSLCREKLPTS